MAERLETLKEYQFFEGFVFYRKPTFMKNFFVYMISNPTGIYYKGFTTDYTRRLEEHNSPLGKYTSERGPWKLIFLQSFNTKYEALIFEKMLKRQNHKYLDWLIDSEKNELNKI
jgi:putative endonuclease|tara:strand:+ start:19239 stop:19580 length:342 start_codon:yes stop_codon:yes gene_type:complete